jgi:ABC-type Na+ transport system ATPase subunit NatA
MSRQGNRFSQAIQETNKELTVFDRLADDEKLEYAKLTAEQKVDYDNYFNNTPVNPRKIKEHLEDLKNEELARLASELKDKAQIVREDIHEEEVIHKDEPTMTNDFSDVQKGIKSIIDFSLQDKNAGKTVSVYLDGESVEILERYQKRNKIKNRSVVFKALIALLKEK